VHQAGAAADQLKFGSREMRIVREGVPNEINPFDRRALAQAVARAKHGNEVIVLTMGRSRREGVVRGAASAPIAPSTYGDMGSPGPAAGRCTRAEACRHIRFDLILT
jgi:electron transfer flavoprotein alpha/beta subunit